MYKFRLPKYRLGYDNEASGIGNLQAEPKLPSIRTSSTDSFRNDDEDDNTRPSMDVSILDDAASSVCIDDYDLGLAGAAVNYLDPILRNGDVQTLRQAKDNIMNDETLTDFDKFNQQTATDMYIQEKLCTVALEREKKQLKRSKRRNKGKSRINNDSSQFYGNYFTSIDPSAESENTFLRREDSEPNGNAISLRHRHVVKVNFSNSFDGKVTEDLEANSIKLSHVTPDISNFANAQGGILSVKSRSKASRKVTFDNGAFVTNATPLDDNSTTGSFDGDTLESIETIIVDVPHAGRDNIYTFPSGQNFCGSYQSGYSIDGRYGRGLQRKLLPRHLPTITFGLTLGAGLFFASGQALLVAGPLGALLAYISVAVIVVCTVLSITELTAYIPMVSGIVGLSSRFVDDAFGFAMGICYWFMFAIALPSHVTAASALLNYYPGFLVPAESIVPWITLFLALIVIVNLLDVRLYGEIKYGLSIVTTVLLLGLLVLMFCSNLGVVGPRFEYVGFKYWDNRQSNLTDNLIYGLFKPFFQTDGKNSIEIEGNLGRFLSVWAAMLIATYSFLGTEAVITTTGEARNPRRSIPSAVKRIFAYVLIGHPFLVLMDLSILISMKNVHLRQVNIVMVITAPG
ncbi:hypothetical protein NADFUDRAFT_68270 [Nadsonia fulvescens var. elongata DSM 6958]|uniref:Amino acid permease/ SLC12A domain-containing protein n=1 Tax=Nadsonia fulvescens var. elongata DSM 6958 TaxID=857566 RepID=A0A1E3PR55_9ASCO|nr:hypothetical protein NADFUDRAFT_68270 [Nadsonia fulvescens var. elongata DSM 6958]